jgi:hypothetical protein
VQSLGHITAYHVLHTSISTYPIDPRSRKLSVTLVGPFKGHMGYLNSIAYVRPWPSQ